MHTGFPHYPSGRVTAPYRNRPLLRETGPGGERVVRSAIYPTANRGFTRRILNHLSLAASALATAPAAGPADVVVVETPPLFLAGAGVAYAAVKRAPLVVNVADRWPASAVQLGALEGPRAIAAAERLERFVYAHAAAITVPTRRLAHEIGAAAPGRVHHLPPAVDLDGWEDVLIVSGHAISGLLRPRPAKAGSSSPYSLERSRAITTAKAATFIAQ